ncbi:hypothetical protein ACQR5W_11570 [Xanthomonas sacchari]
MADMISPLEALSYVQQQGEMGRQRGQQNQLAKLYSQSYSTPPEQQNSLLGQIAAIDPKAAQSQQTQFEGQEDRRMQKLAGAARYLEQARQTKNPQAVQGAWNAVRPMLQREMPQGQFPEQWDDATMAPTLYQVLAQTGGGTQGQVQSTYVDAQGNRVAIMRNGSTQILGQDNPKVQIIDTGDGFYGVNKGTLQAAPVSTRGGSTASAMPTEADMNADAQIANEMIAAGIPEAQVDAFLTARGQRASSMQQPAADNQLRKAPAAVTPYQQAQLGMDQQRLRLQEEANARAQAQADRNNSPGAKPLPLTAQKTAFDLQDQVQNASNVISMAQKHLDRLNSGQLDVSRGAQAAGWLRSTTGLNDENSINLAELDSDKTQIVNESLRLNKGVQTEGDAQRAAREIMAANDSASLKRSLERMQAINRRASQLKQQQLGQLYANYGRGPDGDTQDVAPRAQAPAGAQQGAPGGRTIVRTGTLPDGRKVVQYSDGTTSYGN